MKKPFLFLALLPVNLFAFHPPADNQMAKDYNTRFSSATIPVENQWFYTASGTENLNFSLSQDDNFFEVKMLKNRVLKPEIETRTGGKTVFGLDFYGHRTMLMRVHCPMTKAEDLNRDPFGGLCTCDHRYFFYSVIGSSTILHLKDGAISVKEVK